MMRKLIALTALIWGLGTLTVGFSQNKPNDKVESYLTEFAENMSPKEVAVVHVSTCDSETKIFLTCIMEMSAYVNNLPSSSFTLKGRLFLVYHGGEKLLPTVNDKELKAKVEKILEADLAADGKDRRADYPPNIYDPMFWQLTVDKDGGVTKTPYNGRLPGWSYWRDRH